MPSIKIIPSALLPLKSPRQETRAIQQYIDCAFIILPAKRPEGTPERNRFPSTNNSVGCSRGLSGDVGFFLIYFFGQMVSAYYFGPSAVINTTKVNVLTSFVRRLFRLM